MVNLALLEEDKFKLYSSKVRLDRKSCVFISYKKEDANAAKEIAEYISRETGAYVYLDINDKELQQATIISDDVGIVKSIKKGLDIATHILCVISDRTLLSWWVPYEIGYADKKGINIVSLKLNNIDDVPSYLKIHKVLYNLEDLYDFIKELSPYGGIFMENYNFDLNGIDTLSKYIDR